MLIYLALGIEIKPSLDKRDYLALICAVLVFLFELGAQFSPPFFVGVICLSLALISYVLMVYFLLQSNQMSLSLAAESIRAQNHNAGYVLLKSSNRILSLSTVLCLLTPSFIFFYFLAAIKVIDSSTLLVAYLCCNCSTKLIFVTVAVTSHWRLNTVSKVEMERIQRNIVARALLLRTIDKAVQGPISTLLFGLRLLSERTGVIDEIDPLILVTTTSNTVNDVLKDALGTFRRSVPKTNSHSSNSTVSPSIHMINAFTTYVGMPTDVTVFTHELVVMHQALSRERRVMLTAYIAPDVPQAVLLDSLHLFYAMSIFLQYTMSKCSSGSMNRNTTSNLPFASVGRVTIHVTKEDGVANVRNALSSELESPQSSTLLISLIDEGMTAQWARDSDTLSLLLAMQGRSEGDSFEDILSYENGYSGSVLTDVEGNIRGDGQDRPVENWGGGAVGLGETAGGVEPRRGVDGRVGAVGRRFRTSTIGLYAAPDPPEGRTQAMSAPSSITSEAVAGSGGLSQVGVAELAVCLDWVAMMGGGVTYMPREDGVVGHV